AAGQHDGPFAASKSATSSKSLRSVVPRSRYSSATASYIRGLGFAVVLDDRLPMLFGGKRLTLRTRSAFHPGRMDDALSCAYFSKASTTNHEAGCFALRR